MAGFRTFATGEVLTAANVNDFLMKQSVMVFDDATARTTALGAEVTEGMLTFNKDTGQLEVFDGTNFVVAAPEPPAGIGSNVVSVTKTDTFITPSTSYVDITGLTVTITPSSATSKVMVFYSVMVGQNEQSFPQIRLNRAGTTINVGDAASNRDSVTLSSWTGGADNFATVPAGMFLDSPNTTSATIYKLELRSTNGENQFVNRNRRDNDGATEPRGVSSITVIEVAA